VVLDAPDGGLQHLFELQRQWRDGYGIGVCRFHHLGKFRLKL
jgi:hypothetical protein